MAVEIQKDLTGKPAELQVERVETWKDVIRGQFFQLSVSEEDHSKLDRMHEKGQDAKIRRFIASHMKPHTSLPDGYEGVAFQQDFEKFMKRL